MSLSRAFYVVSAVVYFKQEHCFPLYKSTLNPFHSGCNFQRSYILSDDSFVLSNKMRARVKSRLISEHIKGLRFVRIKRKLNFGLENKFSVTATTCRKWRDA